MFMHPSFFDWIEKHPAVADHCAPYVGLFAFLFGLMAWHGFVDIRNAYQQRKWSYKTFKWYQGWTGNSRAKHRGY